MKASEGPWYDVCMTYKAPNFPTTCSVVLNMPPEARHQTMAIRIAKDLLTWAENGFPKLERYEWRAQITGKLSFTPEAFDKALTKAKKNLDDSE